ncbi:thioredoxin [Alicyclobacillaceae bacterium I2511]|nr:thioredoxin [Alicyclobacillaceae bacterium I2511]
MGTQVVTDQSFTSFLQSDTPVLVDFWAVWCGPCKMIAPVLEEMSGELQGKLKIGRLDVDKNPATTQQFGIMSIPTLLVFKGGKVVKQMIGFRSKADLLSQLSEVI